MWKFAEQDGLGNQIVLGPTINHEVGHVLFDIGHNGDGVANESDINVTDESTDGNNLMTYAGCACAVSVVQFSKIRKSLSKINVPFLDQSDLCTFNQTPIVIPENTYVIWDSYRELTQNVIVEPTATLRITCDIKTLGKFVVKRGAKLIVDGASISNLCEENNWRGIEVWGNPGKEHPTGSDPEGDLVDYDLESDDPGVVYLSGATLIRPVDGVFTWYEDDVHPDSYLWSNYWGGIVQALSTEFVNHRRGVAFMSYTKSDNSSKFSDCRFLSTLGYSGITMWNVKNIKITNCTFLAQNSDTLHFTSGITSIDANPKIDHCSFTGNRYGLEARSTFSYVDDPLHVFNGSHFYATQSYYNITHIFSSGILGLRVEKSEFNRGAYAASFGGNTSFNINRNIFNGYRKSAIKLERTGSRIKQLDFNYLTSNFNTMVTGLSVFRDNFTFQFTSNCFNNPINDVKLELIPLFPDQGSISIANNNYFHPFSSNGPELFSRVTRFDYYIPTSGANSRATPHCHRLTTRPDPNCTTYSIHANVNALTTLPDPPNCEQMAMPDTLDENDYLIDTFAFTYLYNKYEFYKDQSSDLQSEIQNLPPNDPDSAGLASDLNLTQFYLKKYQMSLMQNLYAANDTGTLFDFLTNEEVDDHEMLIAGLEINKGNYAAADSILSELAPISADYDKYYTVEKIHLNFLSDPSSNFPTQNDSLDLESIAIDTSWASSYAKALLVLYY
jgi:hypothetical protein